MEKGLQNPILLLAITQGQIKRGKIQVCFLWQSKPRYFWNSGVLERFFYERGSLFGPIASALADSMERESGKGGNANAKERKRNHFHA